MLVLWLKANKSHRFRQCDAVGFRLTGGSVHRVKPWPMNWVLRLWFSAVLIAAIVSCVLVFVAVSKSLSALAATAQKVKWACFASSRAAVLSN